MQEIYPCCLKSKYVPTSFHFERDFLGNLSLVEKNKKQTHYNIFCYVLHRWH